MSKLGDLIRKSLVTRQTISVLVLVLLGTWAFESATAREQLPISNYLTIVVSSMARKA